MVAIQGLPEEHVNRTEARCTCVHAPFRDINAGLIARVASRLIATRMSPRFALLQA